MKSLSGETKLFLGIILVTILIIGGAIFFFAKKESAPPLSKTDLITPDAHTYGNASASAFLVEFSDFQCPACGVYEPIVRQIRETYKDRLVLAYRQFPLTQHEHADKAAKASEAAANQNKFWEMHDALFNKQADLSDPTIAGIVTELQLNADQFNKDINEASIAAVVQHGIDDGTRFGVDSTPTFFLNGKKLQISGPQDLLTAVQQTVK